jgi:hypothetical protein
LNYLIILVMALNRAVHGMVQPAKNDGLATPRNLRSVPSVYHMTVIPSPA